jgi:HPt (histidine-containing phosphotransfer) domain-containing protein
MYYTDLAQIARSLEALTHRLKKAEIREPLNQGDQLVIHILTLPEEVDRVIAGIRNSIEVGFFIDNYNDLEKR